MKHFFSPNSSGDLRLDSHQSQIIGGDADEDHTQMIGGMQSNYWGGICPFRVSAPLDTGQDGDRPVNHAQGR